MRTPTVLLTLLTCSLTPTLARAQEPLPIQSAPIVVPATQDPGTRIGAAHLESLAKGRDMVVRQLGDQQLRASDVFRVLDLAYPALVEETLGEMLVTLGVHLEAQREGIDVDAAVLDAEVRRAMTQQQLEFTQSVGEGFTLEQYLAERHGMSVPDWEREARRMVLASMLRDRVVRLHSWRKPRDELQIILVSDPLVAEEIEGKLADGASFSALAKQHSLHPSKTDGGLMPPLAQGLEVPLVMGRERLELGEWLGPAPLTIQETDYLRFVRLVDHMPAELATWSELRARIESSLEERAVGPDELLGFEGALRERYGVAQPAAASGAEVAPGSTPEDAPENG
ncbi:MAG: hypothetical protein DHS20C15_04870 [Planctomycetota bacterium]|nr:MAG: hypothetical protein DHS20C15_04870 [Planctomycetota bacterium]